MTTKTNKTSKANIAEEIQAIVDDFDDVAQTVELLLGPMIKKHEFDELLDKYGKEKYMRYFFGAHKIIEVREECIDALVPQTIDFL